MTQNEVCPENEEIVHEKLYGTKFPPLYKKPNLKWGSWYMD